jgi:D-tyrosyl-tRNA(Tyr) deacylase
MRVVLQRVSRAEVRVAGHPPARIGRGFLLLVGFGHGDGEAEAAWMARKIAGLRLFPDAAHKMNLALADVGGRCLAVSQFTLLADASKGRRPTLEAALDPAAAAPLFDRFVELLAAGTGPVATGVFGAHMEVELVNDGPVTLLLERGPPIATCGTPPEA